MVAPTLTLTFDQADAGIPAGQLDRARTDIKSTGVTDATRAYPVDITVGGVPDGASADVALLDEPPSSNPTLTQLTPTSFRLEFDVGCWGPFRVRARAVSSDIVLASVVRRISIRSPQLGMQYPANAERTDPGATSVASAPSVALTEMNEGGTNNALAAFHRELITKVESAVSEGGIAEPALHTKLYDTSIEYLSGPDKYRVAAGLQTDIGNSLQIAHLAILPVEKFTYPVGTPLSDANLQDAVDRARTYAVAQGGGRIAVPLGPHAGRWHPTPTAIPNTSTLEGQLAALILRGAGYGIPLQFETPPGGGIIVAPSCAVGLYVHSPKAVGSDPALVLTYSGVREFWVTPETDGQNCDAIRINAAVDCWFDNLKAFSFNGNSGGKRGVGVKVIDDWGGDGNSQMCRFSNISSVGNQISYYMGEISSSYAVHMNSAAALYRSWFCERGAEVFVQSSGLQDGIAAQPLVEMTGAGPIMHFADCYTETGGVTGGTVFQIHDLTSQGSLHVTRYRLGAPFDLFLDVSDACKVLVDGGYALDAATKFLRALPASEPNAFPIRINNAGGILAAGALDAGKFELNASSRAKLTVTSGGDTYSGGKVWHGLPTQLASFSEGSEPASPVESEILWNASTHRPRVRSVSSHRDLAYADDPKGINGLLKPYAAMILDPRVYKTRGIISSAVDTLGDIMHPGTNASAPASGRRPAYNAASDAFGGKPTLSCSNSGDTMLQITLASVIAAASNPGIFAVVRGTSAYDSAHRRRILTCIGSPYALMGNDIEAGSGAWQAQYTATSVVHYSTVSGLNDQYPHVLAVNLHPRAPDPGEFAELQIDGTLIGGLVSTDPTVTVTGGSQSAITGAYIGAYNATASAGNCADIELAYVALLRDSLPLSVLAQVWDLANAEWSLGL